ncbi:MAG: hypothetical protein ACXWFS_09070 [Thermoanaerobaculia bacterium]
MDTIRAEVKNGRLVVDAPTSLPEGTTLELTIADEGDDLGEVERAALHAALDESFRQAKHGEVADANVAIRKLRSRG